MRLRRDEKKSLYVSRGLLNADDFIAWAKEAGFAKTLAADDMHVTVAFSRKPVDWAAAGEHLESIIVPPASEQKDGERSIEKLGDKGAVVLRFESPELADRWQQFRDIGASWDWPGYKPHVTITYAGGDVDLDGIEPYQGELRFGPERFAELDENWTDKVIEDSILARRRLAMPQILTPADFMMRLKQGETREQILLDDAGRMKAKLAGIAASIEIASEDRAVDFVISTGALDRYNSTIAPKGWRIENFNRNPVVLWAHDDSIPAIGRAENTQIGASVRSRAIFADRDTHPLADTVYRLVKAKFINAASVGWIPLKWQFVEEEGRGFGVDYLEQELLEWSVVNIPANPECLVDARSMGIDTKPLLVWAERALDQGGMLMIPRADLEQLRKAAGSPTMSRPRKPEVRAVDQQARATENTNDADEAFATAAAAAKTLFAAGILSNDAFTDMIIELAAKSLTRAGRVLSKDNEEKLRRAHEHCAAAMDHCRQACDHVMGVVDQNRDDADPDADPEHPSGDDDNDPDDPDNQDRAAQDSRSRRMRFLKLSTSRVAIAAATKPAA
jgi:HK97 family phage prohead protease